MPKPKSDGSVNYVVVEPKDEARAKKMIEDKIAGRGITVEAHHARVNDDFPEGWQGSKGKKFVFLSSSDDNKFNLGTAEYHALLDAGMQAGIFLDQGNIIQNALEGGMSRKQG